MSLPLNDRQPAFWRFRRTGLSNGGTANRSSISRQTVCRTVGLLAQGTLAPSGGGAVRIVVETREHLPDIEDPEILAVERNGNRAKADIRDRLATSLFEQGIHVREMRLEEPDIEDVFMAVYRR